MRTLVPQNILRSGAKHRSFATTQIDSRRRRARWVVSK